GVAKLLDRLHDHRAAPDDGRIAVQQERHAHHFEPEIFDRIEFVPGHRRALHRSHHFRHAGPVNVRVHHADLLAEVGEGASEVHRHGGFADAALAAADGHNMFYPYDLGSRGCGACARHRYLTLLWRLLRGHLD